MKNVSDKRVEKIKTHILCSTTFFFCENRAVYEIMWSPAGHMTTWRMRIAYGIPKDINTYSDYIILIAFPLEQWLRERTSMLR